jgi:imidazolonepropionase-like amidohydrolase
VLWLKAAGFVDVDAGEIIAPAVLQIEDDRIVGIGGEPPAGAEVIDLGDQILLPGLMDMEVNLLMGGRGENPGLSQVQDDPPTRVLRAVGNARRTLRAGFTTVRNLGLFVKTGGYLLDVALGKAIDAGWIEGPRIVPAGHAITPTGGHLDPTMFAGFMPGVLELTVEEGIANGVDEIRKAVRYQIKHGAQLIKVCCSGGVMSLTGSAGAQHYSDEELLAIVDEAHRRGLRVAAHTHGAEAVKHAVACGIDCIEHGFLMDDEAIAMLVEHGTFLVTTRRLAEAMDVSKAPKALQEKAAEMFPKARTSIKAAYEAGVKIAVGTDAPAIPHGRNADELVTLVDWGMPPAAVLRAATVIAADLINVTDRGRIAQGQLADIIAVPGDPLADMTVTQNVSFVMKGGKVYVNENCGSGRDSAAPRQVRGHHHAGRHRRPGGGVHPGRHLQRLRGYLHARPVPGAGGCRAQGPVHDGHCARRSGR